MSVLDTYKEYSQKAAGLNLNVTRSFEAGFLVNFCARNFVPYPEFSSNGGSHFAAEWNVPGMKVILESSDGGVTLAVDSGSGGISQYISERQESVPHAAERVKRMLMNGPHLARRVRKRNEKDYS